MNDSEEVDEKDNASSLSETITHTVERKEISVRQSVYRTTSSNPSDEAAPLPSSSQFRRSIQTPLESSSTATRRSQGNPAPQSFKHYGYRMRLYCRTRYYLMIERNGSVHGGEISTHPGGVLEFSSAGLGELRIRAVDANLYLAMNKNGDLYGEEDPRDYATVFIEGTFGQYNTYLSQKYAHLGWYVGIKKTGVIKKGPLTKWGQKAIQFLPVRSN